MKRKASIEELEARVKAGDRTFLYWLRSGERREELATAKNHHAIRFLGGYWRKVLSSAVSPTLILNVGCGLGADAANVLRTGNAYARYVGMDHDPECVRLCRRYFNALPSIQFHVIDYLQPPKLPRKFDYIVVSNVINSLPRYQDLLSYLWHRCDKAMLVLFSETMTDRQTDALTIESPHERIYASYSAPKFQAYVQQMAGHASYATVFSDNGQEKSHVALLRHADSVPDLVNVHQFADNETTFPFYAEGLQ